MTLLKRLVLLFPGGAILSFATLAFLLASQKPGCSCGPNGAAKTVLGSLNRAYQVSRLESGRFADPNQIAQEVNVTLEESVGKFLYRSELVSGDIAVSYAVPHDAYFYPKIGPFTGKRRPTYYSHVSAIAFNPDTRHYQSVLCSSVDPSSYPLAAPKFIKGKWQCPARSKRLVSSAVGIR